MSVFEQLLASGIDFSVTALPGVGFGIELNGESTIVDNWDAVSKWLLAEAVRGNLFVRVASYG